ncbi:hypothetical protein [Bradyrhizobium sp. sBnM-33]|nr:hypothetical protein [Bradyrhizobium sp. sBnM-33]WOH52502.1 hypothetical protein RX328_10220 [Bradyrhizobium sp. sBnM-33]
MRLDYRALQDAAGTVINASKSATSKPERDFATYVMAAAWAAGVI